MSCVAARLSLIALVAAGCQFSIRPASDASAPVDDFGVGGNGEPDFAQPIPRGLGAPCLGVADCESATCVDGVCCDSLCDPSDPANLCKACNVAGHEGHCFAATGGTDAGGCRAVPLGQPCTLPSDCASGFCAPQGVCCDAACTGNCRSCALGIAPGHCTPLGAGTQCAPRACMGDSNLSARACDGAGTCAAATATDCTPYTCNPAGAVCFTRPCAGNQQCAQGHTCNSGSTKCM
jgi:hypothetical protein